MNEKMSQIVEPIERLLEQLDVSTVFGEPTKEGDTTVIPVAEIRTGFGYGYGFGSSPSAVTEGEAAGMNEGGGGGGGAGGRATPLGYVQITPARVQFVPIMDQARIAVAGMAMSAWVVFWIAKTVRTVAKQKKVS